MVTMISKAAKPKSPKIALPVDAKRLARCIADDFRILSSFRAQRTKMIRHLAGDNYGENTGLPPAPLNMLALYLDVMTTETISNCPQVMYSTYDERTAAAVDAMQDWANEQIAAMRAQDIFRMAITDAFFWQGIVRVALADVDDAEEAGWSLKAGTPFMDAISPNDFVCDQGVRQFSKVEYSACRYRLPVALANEMYRTSRQEKFEPDTLTDFNHGGDDRTESISSSAGEREEIEDHCTIWEVWHPRHKLVSYLRDNMGTPDESKEPIAVKRWIGHSRGPYVRLSLGDIPDNINPKGKACDLFELHINLQHSWRKLLHETKDYKKVYPYRGKDSDDAQRLKLARDGELFNCEDPDSLKALEFGGAGNALFQMTMAMQEAFNFIGGNLSLIAGRGAQSRTATQDKILNENASSGIAGIQDRTIDFMAECFNRLNFLWWYHPTKVMQSPYQTPSYNGPEGRIMRPVGPWNSGMKLNRNGPLPRLKVDVHSLIRQNPASRLAFINQTLQVVGPLMQYAMQQGVNLDMNALLALFAKYGYEPDLKKIFHYVEPAGTDGQKGPSHEASPRPAETTRRYERYSSGGESPNAKMASISEGMAQMQAGPVNPNSGVQ